MIEIKRDPATGMGMYDYSFTGTPSGYVMPALETRSTWTEGPEEGSEQD